MKTIDTCIQEFLATLQHTPGPWKITGILIEAKKANPAIEVCSVSSIDWITRELIPNEEQVTPANSKLISSSPGMLSTLCYTYLTLLVKFAYGQNSTCNEIRISLDGTLASLRNSISVATGLECEHVQTVFEQYVKEIGHGN